MNLKRLIDQAVAGGLANAGFADTPAVVKQAARPEFGDYQANGVMAAAKRAGRNPREVAGEVAAGLDVDFLESPEVAGPGFINLTLSASWIAEQMQARYRGGESALDVATARIAIDYSSPNLAKEMHVGHLRPTVIGDALVRVLEFLGNDVIRVNHVGDWGAQFGSLLAFLDELPEGERGTSLKDLEAFYREASARFRSDETFATKARGFVVKLQSGDPACSALWEQFIAESIAHCEAVYDLFNITLTTEDIRAESAYNDDLPRIVTDLEQQGLITVSDGAKCVFLPGFTGKDDKPLPAIVQKSDGGYPYLATDVAALRYRAGELGVDKAYYVVGAPQTLHLKQLFALGEAAGYVDGQDFRHVPFGSILKDDGKPFKTRDGADVKLVDVLHEAVARAHDVVTTKNPELSESEREEVARVVGIGAVKYAELSKNRMTDYIFDWDAMLSFEGNTAPYLQYAYTRIRSIFRRADADAAALDATVVISEPAERALCVKLLQFQETVEQVTADNQPNVLCNYLYELAQSFMSFYETCPVLSGAEAERNSRLVICATTARTLQLGLSLLGIETVEQM